MKKFVKILTLSSFVLLCANGLTSCSKTTGLTLRILNSEDYIYLYDPENGYYNDDLVDQFKAYIEENYPEYHGVNVVYDTSDTNETIYSEIQTGKSHYDLINVSEYMAQKIVSGGFAIEIDQSKVPNYQDFASAEIKSRLDNMETTIVVKDETSGEYEKQTVKLENYAVGYMWGTLGILFNPDYSAYSNLEEGEMVTDMMSYDALWDSKYKGTISIKNSMRDTYALGIMYAFEDDFAEYKAKYDQYLEDTEAGIPNDYDLDAYKADFAKTFNRSDTEAIAKVQEALQALKTNIFGLEVDSGKQDIVTQKIGVNLAWSGDAVYAMDQADANGVTLQYSVPELGSNIWSDVWIMPNVERSDAQYELAHLFLDFICNPEIASQNMDYTGYTSFIGGDSILELARDWFDIRTDEIYEEVEDDEGEITYCPVYSITDSEYTALDYPDFVSTTHDVMREDEALVYFIPFEEEVDDETVLVEEPRNYDELIENSEVLYIKDEEGEPTKDAKYYRDLTLVDLDEDIKAVDLTYFFDGTLDEYSDEDMIFYSDEYLPYTYEDENGDEVQNVCVGRQFFVQYPNEETINRCAIMIDYGENNTNVMKMWENFKSDSLPVWAIVTFAVIASFFAFLGIYFLVNKLQLRKVKKNRKVD